MNEMTLQQFMAAIPCSYLTAVTWYPHIMKAMECWDIHTPVRQAAFIAQISFESRRLACVEEELNYTPERLMAVWPTRFPNLEFAKLYARNPKRLANFVYANRFGNGPVESGDGYKFRGRGPKQITFQENYLKCGIALHLKLVDFPDLLLDHEHGAQAAGWFWKANSCNAMADAGNFKMITKAINGSTVTNDARLPSWKIARAALNLA